MEDNEHLDWRSILARGRRLWWLLPTVVGAALVLAFVIKAPGWTASVEFNAGEQPDVSTAAKVLDLPPPLLTRPDAGLVGRLKDPQVTARVLAVAPGARITVARQGTTNVYFLAVGAKSRASVEQGIGVLHKALTDLWNADARTIRANLDSALGDRGRVLTAQLAQLQKDLGATDPGSGAFAVLLADRARTEGDLGRIESMRSLVAAYLTAADAQSAAAVPAVSHERVGYTLAVGSLLAVALLAVAAVIVVLLEQSDTRIRTRTQLERLTGGDSVMAILTKGDTDVAILAAVLKHLVPSGLIAAVLVPAGDSSTAGLADRLGRRLTEAGGAAARVTASPSFLEHSTDALEAVRSAEQVVLVVEAGRTTINDAEYVFKTLCAIDRPPHAVVIDGVPPGQLSEASR